MGLFGSDDLNEVADLLATEPTLEAVRTELRTIDRRIDQTARELELYGSGVSENAETVRIIEELAFAAQDERIRRVEQFSDETRGRDEFETHSADRSNTRRVGTDQDDPTREEYSRIEPAVASARGQLGDPSEETRALFDALEDGSAVSTTDALIAAGEQLDRATEGSRSKRKSAQSGDSPDGAETELRQRIDDLSTAVQNQLNNRLQRTMCARLGDLRTRLNGGDTAGIADELQFYEETLVDTLAETADDESGANTSGASENTGGTRDSVSNTVTDDSLVDRGSGRKTDSDTGYGDPEGVAAPTDEPSQEQSATAEVERINERRREVTEQYVNRREDHNHSIPLVFLSTVDSLEETATTALAGGEYERAVGVATATHSLLDTVETLYERNEYSVMLRSLRG